MENLEKQIVRIIENNSPELAAEEILRLFSVVGRSEQLPCEMCGGKIDKEDKFTDEKHCENCGWF
jgi:hypothetical protein